MNFESGQNDRGASPEVAPDDLSQPVVRSPEVADRVDEEALASLFTPEAARAFRADWDAVQIGFVDNPQQAVQKADELVRQVLENLGQTFSAERSAFDGRGDETEQASTERLRMALRRYRAFLNRLLSL
ncbi:hypothetical protein [Variovorax sp. JS1663]|uniref:hypothetical protein n=1 Tax=Variovorax sp. JS1663 TaxID=1851577 RepID=UPI000B349245|nr:hypothetical protein [Variovorax sp. JS1663]OUM04226.1 hypothetical protein A8M77_00480 [Variovorax sp. JS1663]